jgi:two-component system sensor histidine kinase YesM
LNDFENLDRTHIGICNVNQRIQLQYGDEYGVTIESAEGEGTRVTILLPVLLY